MEANKVYNEDCLSTLNRFDDESIDCVITSPPYDAIKSCKVKTKMRTYKGYEWDFENIAKELCRVIKPGRCCVWITGDETKNFCETLSSFKQAIYFVEECGFNLLDTMIYKKSGGPPQYPGMRRYAQRFEYMFIFCKGKPLVYNPIKDVLNKYRGKMNKASTQRQKDGSTKFCGDYLVPEYSIRGNVWEYSTGYNVDTSDKIAMKHPARFPEKLAQDHILTWTNEEEIVYDPFMGSGTTAKMCLLNNRKYIGSELSLEYCELIEKRLKNI